MKASAPTIVDRQRIDDALVSAAALIRALTSDDVGRVATEELDYVRSSLSPQAAPAGAVEATAHFLFKLLDDIDTLDDACKEDDAAFRRLAYKVQRRRFEVVGDIAEWNRRSALSPSPSQPDGEIERLRARLFDDQQPMACEAGEMTAAEDVLAWLLIEKIGVPDDQTYTPHQAQKIIAANLDNGSAAESRAEALSAALEKEADLFWDDDNPEESYRDIEDIADQIGESAWFTVRRAKSLPDAHVSCVTTEDGHSWIVKYHDTIEDAKAEVIRARNGEKGRG